MTYFGLLFVVVVGVVADMQQPVGVPFPEKATTQQTSDKYDAINVIGSVNLIRNMLSVCAQRSAVALCDFWR